MNHHSRYRSLAPLAAALSLALLAGVAQASSPKAPKNVDQARLNYERERADCMMGRTNQPRNVCLKEATNAYADARRGKLTSPSDDASMYAANAAQRCEAQKGDMREMCLRRVAGEGTVSGSVAQGGTYEELITRTPTAAGPAQPQQTPPPKQ